MTEQHPITPPPELVDQWDEEGTNMFRPSYQIHLTTQAARWGADQELEACCDFIKNSATNFSASAHLYAHRQSDQLRAARRPKPPSLKDQAMDVLKRLPIDPEAGYCPSELDTIRRALEQLPDSIVVFPSRC